jgi:hypothetical protein
MLALYPNGHTDPSNDFLRRDYSVMANVANEGAMLDTDLSIRSRFLAGFSELLFVVLVITMLYYGSYPVRYATPSIVGMSYLFWATWTL